MTLNTQTDCGCQNENGERSDDRKVDATRNHPVLVAAGFPDSSDVGCCGTTLARGQVTGADGSDEVSGFGQKATLLLTRRESGVATGCGCGPRGDFSDGRENGQPPLRVDLLDRAPLNVVVGENVADSNSSVVNAERRTPESRPHAKSEQCGQGRAVSDSVDVDGEDDGCLCNRENDPGRHGEASAKSGAEHGHAVHRATEVTR